MIANRHQQQQGDNNYQTELANFAALRHSDSLPSTSKSLSTIPSQELIYKRDESHVKPTVVVPPNPVIQKTFYIDDEIEEGEIVESEVTGIVNLLEESFAAVKQSQKIVDFSSPSKLFYEDRLADRICAVPQYTTYGNGVRDTTADESNKSDDVICLDSTFSDVDDSVIFVSEEKLPLKLPPPPLVIPDCLKSPAVKKLLNLVPAQSPSPVGKAPSKRNTPKRKLRMALWKQKKAVEFAEINAANGKKTDQVKKIEQEIDEPRPSTSVEILRPAESPKFAFQKDLEKRIVLIDGSNLAMSFTDNYGAKKTDKDFSAEGERLIKVEL